MHSSHFDGGPSRACRDPPALFSFFQTRNLDDLPEPSEAVAVPLGLDRHPGWLRQPFPYCEPDHHWALHASRRRHAFAGACAWQRQDEDWATLDLCAR